MATQITSYLPYHEPGIVTILIQSSFLLVLNILNSIFDSLIYCGLLAQVFVGVAWGTPGGKILGTEFENVVVQLGYLGLILLVYEGGLSTDIKSLKANLPLSTLVATTGIALPIGLSFTLAPLLNATPLQCFAAGAALCSTSLGTTFTILRTSGLAKSKLGVVLASAAMMDDVVGLIMVQVISNLGSAGSGDFGWETVVRPLGVSLAFAICTPLACWCFGKYFARFQVKGVVERVLRSEHAPFAWQTLLLLGMVAGAVYAGTSCLFTAYLAGAVVSWWDGVRQHAVEQVSASLEESNVNCTGSSMHSSRNDLQQTSQVPESSAPITPIPISKTSKSRTSGVEVYEKYYATALHRMLKPFFFASIGFAIPITEMFSAQVVWRGLVYTILMVIAKLATGLWLVRLDLTTPNVRIPSAIRQLFSMAMGCLWRGRPTRTALKRGKSREMQPIQGSQGAESQTNSSAPQRNSSRVEPTTTTPSSQAQPSKIQKPLSLYPATMLGTAMTARGEIGFLIASVAASTGLFDSAAEKARENSGSSEIYLVVVWAVVLCTIIGPLSVGSLVRRVKRLEKSDDGRVMERREDGPLGVWGLE